MLSTLLNAVQMKDGGTLYSVFEEDNTLKTFGERLPAIAAWYRFSGRRNRLNMLELEALEREQVIVSEQVVVVPQCLKKHRSEVLQKMEEILSVAQNFTYGRLKVNTTIPH